MLKQKKEKKPTQTKLWLVLGLLLMAVLALSACGDQREEAAATPAAPAEEVVVAPPTEVVQEEAAVVPTTEVVEEEAAVVPTTEATEEVAMATPGADAAPMTTDQTALRASELIGYQVKNFQGEDLGEVEDVVLGLHQNMDYAVLSFGGFLDIGDKLFAIPLSVVTTNTKEDTLYFDIAEQDLENAPGFTDDAWPEVANATWDDDILEFWGRTQEAALPTDAGEMAETTTGPAAIRASEVMGDSLINAAGEDIGEVEDVLVNLEPNFESGEGADYAVVSFGGFADIGDEMFIIPLRHLDLSAPEAGEITFNVDEATLQNAPSFTEDAWPDLTDPAWDDDAFTFWDANAVTDVSGSTSMNTPEEGTTTGQVDSTTAMTGTGPEVAVVTIAVITEPEPAIRTSELIGYRVVNPQGEDLGEIEDLVIGRQSGRVRYAVLSFGGFLGIGDDLFPIPLNAMTLNRDDNTLVLDVSEETFENASGFGEDIWPDLNNPAWDADFGAFWENELGVAQGPFIGEGAGDEAFTSEAGLRVTDLMGYPVRNSQDEALGEIEDLLLGVNSGRAGYAILSFGGFLELGEKQFIIPMNALAFDLENEVARLNVDQETLENAPGFEADNALDLADPAWDTDYRDFWENNNAAAPGDTADTDVDAGTSVMTDTTTTGPVAPGTDPADMTAVQVNEPALRASELLDYQIRNTQGEEIGEIEDLIVGANSERMRYAIVSFGGLADIGDDLFLLPLNATALSIEDQALIANIDEAQLQNAPSFTADAWPDLTDSTWDNDFLTFWNSPDIQDEPGLRASELIGYNIVNSQGENLGEIEDVMVGLNSGRITYAILSFGGFLGLGEQVFAIPLNVLNFGTINREDQSLTFDVDQETIQNAPGINPADWADATDPRWGDEVIDYWEANAVASGPKAFRASDLIGYNVINAQGEDLGEVTDVMVGLDSGRVNYAVLSFGGFLGLGEKLFAVPLSSMQFSLDEEALIFDVPEERLQNAPGFDNDAWPDAANPQWDLEVRKYWQSPETPTETAVRGSELLDYTIQNTAGDDLGEIEDFLVSLNNGQIQYAILSFGGFADISDTRFAVPWKALNFAEVDQENGVLTFNIDEQALQNAPGFTDETWPDTATPGWDDDFFNFWGRMSPDRVVQ